MLTKNQKRTYLYPPGAGLTISMPVSETESGESSKGSGKFRLAGPPIRQLQLDLAAARSQFSRYPMIPAISFVSLRPRTFSLNLSACHAQAGSRHACCKLARPSRQEPCCWRQSLIIIKILLNAEKLELLTGLFSLANQFPNHHQAHVLQGESADATRLRQDPRQTPSSCGY